MPKVINSSKLPIEIQVRAASGAVSNVIVNPGKTSTPEGTTVLSNSPFIKVIGDKGLVKAAEKVVSEAPAAEATVTVTKTDERAKK